VLADRVAPCTVALCWRTWPAHGLVEQWTEVANEGPAPMRVHQLASAAPALPAAAHLTHWGGGWAHEWTPTTAPVLRGTTSVASAGGVRASLHLSPLVLWSLDGPPAEEEGAVLAASLVWGGDVRATAERTIHDQARLIVGVEHRGAERHLDPGEVHVAPPVVLGWSEAGVGPLSRRLHRWIRAHVVRDGDRPRAIAFNNWEAQGFALDTASVQEVIDGAAAIGAELFLLDDGWFGTSHPRDDDTQGLGDWEVDRAKFPDGLGPVVDHALAAGLRFGLWVEPEMVNPRSATYEAHPDWVLAAPGRERREERQQLVLDVCQPEVAEFAIGVVDRALALHPGISYLKWDANRDVFEAGSSALAPERQSHLPIDRVRATLALMDEVVARHPDVELMLCASGGGRSDLAHLARFHELWTSDDTDPVDRVRLQWGASHLLPAIVLGAHVTRWGAKPVAFGCAVAMSARFGFDLDPRGLDDDERTACEQAVETYRQIRPLVQFGDLHRLVSPIGSPRGALAILAPDAGSAVDPDQPCAVVFAYALEPADGSPPADLVLGGLDPDRRYVVVDATPGDARRGEALARQGRELAAGASGLEWPEQAAPAAKVWTIWPEG
jgi:alpha-galactosidase